MASVEIEFCMPCGFLNRAEDVQHALLTSFREGLDDVTLRIGDDGVFTVTVDGEVVFDKTEDEYDVDGIVRSVRERL